MKAPGVTGKFVDVAVPVTYALPLPSTAIPFALSQELPSRYVEYKITFPPGFSFVTKMFV
jgi:hypothetical protein